MVKVSRLAPEYAYSDRDVRENEDLRHLVIEYLDTYGGTFEPLVRAQEFLQDHDNLPTSSVRVVLNCMRHDFTVVDSLPLPERKVTMSRKLRAVSDYKQPTYELCKKIDPHEWHTNTLDDSGSYNRCPGVPFLINRVHNLDIKLNIKMQYVRAKSGKYIHTVKTGLAADHWCRWTSKDVHSEGQRTSRIMSVDLVCKFPSRIVGGVLMDALEASNLVHHFSDIFWCPYCEDESLPRL